MTKAKRPIWTALVGAVPVATGYDKPGQRTFTIKRRQKLAEALELEHGQTIDGFTRLVPSTIHGAAEGVYLETTYRLDGSTWNIESIVCVKHVTLPEGAKR